MEGAAAQPAGRPWPPAAGARPGALQAMSGLSWREGHRGQGRMQGWRWGQQPRVRKVTVTPPVAVYPDRWRGEGPPTSRLSPTPALWTVALGLVPPPRLWTGRGCHMPQGRPTSQGTWRLSKGYLDTDTGGFEGANPPPLPFPPIPPLLPFLPPPPTTPTLRANLHVLGSRAAGPLSSPPPLPLWARPQPPTPRPRPRAPFGLHPGLTPKPVPGPHPRSPPSVPGQSLAHPHSPECKAPPSPTGGKRPPPGLIPAPLSLGRGAHMASGRWPRSEALTWAQRGEPAGSPRSSVPRLTPQVASLEGYSREGKESACENLPFPTRLHGNLPTVRSLPLGLRPPSRSPGTAHCPWCRRGMLLFPEEKLSRPRSAGRRVPGHTVVMWRNLPASGSLCLGCE